MTIGELAKQAKVSTRALRHYEELGLLKPQRSESSYRVYQQQDLTRVNQIRWLLQLGLNLKQVERVLDGGERPQRLVEVQLARVEGELAQLNGLREKLVRLKESLDQKQIPTRDELLSSLEVLSMMDRPEQDPILLELGSGLLNLCNPGDAPWEEGSALIIGIKNLRVKLQDEGVFLPGVRIKDDASLEPQTYRLTLFQRLQGEGRLQSTVQPLLDHLHEIFQEHRAQLNLLR